MLMIKDQQWEVMQLYVVITTVSPDTILNLQEGSLGAPSSH